MLRVRARLSKHSWALDILLLVLENEIWLRIPQVQGVASGQCSAEHSVFEVSPVVEDSVVPMASDLQRQVPANILPDPVLQSVSGDFEFNKRDLLSSDSRCHHMPVHGALCFAAAFCFLSDPHSALHTLPALTDAHADDSLMHGALNSFVLCRKGPTGRRCTKGGASGPAEDLRPVSEVEAGVNFRPAGGVRGQVAGSTSQDSNQAQVPGDSGLVWTHLPSTRRFLIPQFVSPGRGLDIRLSMGWTKVCETARSGIWVLQGNARARMLP